jgi:glycosyltransferase involved in cell wall biosynthesis
VQHVSVVIPVYNGEKYLAEAIESALAQDYPRVEVVVIDDGSTDGSGQIASGYGEAIHFLSQERGGNGAARNYGVSKSQGELLAFLDADDRWHPTKLGRECEALAARPELSGARSLVHEFVSPEIDEETRRRIRATHSAIPGLHHYGTMRREAFERLGGFTTDLQLAVGVDFSARWADLGLESELINETLVERRLHKSNNWTREAGRHSDLALAVKASLERRRKGAGPEPSA